MSSHNENNESDLESFTYFISHKGSILVASLAGLCENHAIELLKECKSEIEQRLSEIQGVVLNLAGLTGIANDLVPFWAQLQSMIRSSQVELRLCGIETELKEKLHRFGVLRTSETSASLKDALPEIVTVLKKNTQLKQASAPHKKAA